jgi:DNA ligase (NAD+)
LFEQLEEKRTTTFERFLYAQSIPLIGRTASKDIAKFCNGDIEEFCNIMSNGQINKFTQIEGFGKTMCDSLKSWFNNHWIEFLDLKGKFIFIIETSKNNNSGIDLNGVTFCITGKLEHFSNRDALVADIEQHGGKYVSGVTAKTNYLINNDINSTSGKNKKAKEVGCKIISEQNYLDMIK